MWRLRNNREPPALWSLGRSRRSAPAKATQRSSQPLFHITRLMAGQTVLLIGTDDHLLVFYDRGTEIMQHAWPKPGTTYVSSGRPRGRHPAPSACHRCPDAGIVTDVLMQNCHPCPDISHSLPSTRCGHILDTLRREGP